MLPPRSHVAPGTDAIADRAAGLTERRRAGLFLLIDQALVRAGVRRFLEERQRYLILGEGGDPRHSLGDVCRSLADVVVCACYSVETCDFGWIQELKSSCPACRVLLLNEDPELWCPREALTSGADGLIPTAAEPSELLLALESIRNGYAFLSPTLARLALERP